MEGYLFSLNMGGGLWFCFKVMCQNLLTTHGKPYSLQGVDGRLGGKEGQVEGGGE